MPDFVDEILDFFVVYRQFRIFYTTDLGNSGYLDLHSEPVQREGEAQSTT